MCDEREYKVDARDRDEWDYEMDAKDEMVYKELHRIHAVLGYVWINIGGGWVRLKRFTYEKL